VWWHRDPPSPRARALELAHSIPTASYYETTAIYQAAMFREQVAPGSLTRLTPLPRVQLSRIADGRPLPLVWRVTFTDRRSGKVFPTRCSFSLSTVNDYLASARGQADRPGAQGPVRPKPPAEEISRGGATPGL
jgi:hypothetical protein